MSKRKVVVTGAAGYVAGRMIPALAERYELTLLDRRNRNRAGEVVPGLIEVDLTDPNRDAYRQYFRGADAVVHCAWIRGTHGDDETRFRTEYASVGLAYNVYQVALEEGVRRVVVCSSNHAADYYERLIWADKWDNVTPETRPLSDNFYGWCKEAYEHLGFVFATGAERGGRQLENVQVRIGGPRETDFDNPEILADPKQLRRALGAYFSQRDQIQLFVKAIEADDIRDANGVPFLIVYGISGNSSRFWSIVSAQQKLGYVPEDDSSVKFAARILEARAPAAPST